MRRFQIKTTSAPPPVAIFILTTIPAPPPTKPPPSPPQLGRYPPRPAPLPPLGVTHDASLSLVVNRTDLSKINL